MFPSQFANIFLTYQTFVTNLHFLGAEWHFKLREKLHRMTQPLIMLTIFGVSIAFPPPLQYSMVSMSILVS